MAKISLRVYNREIETMIDRGQTEEAIAHCKFILKTYPKHLETYRLLGKAFLESQRYSEAADILQRILSVQPDDFVSQIGMSIIREDEGNLDAAIYHMERAFEIQPSNAAIQDELRRLYGRRDGIEPPKLRLTRGALVRMYARGDLYRQAIAESRAALKEDPQRLDLEIVLARMYFQTGQKAEAAEISSRLITKLPYCFEANRILAEVLPETTRAEDARGVQQKLLALDPYLGYSDTMQGTSQSPDNAVTLDRLEWMPSMETDQQPSWARSLGVKIDDAETEKMPKWMNAIETGGSSAQLTTEESAARPFSEEPSLFENRLEMLNASPEQSTPSHVDQDMPDWMQSAGWAISDHPTTEEPVLAEETPELDTATPAELPSWLKEMAPDQTPAETHSGSDWLGGIGSDSQSWAPSQPSQSSVNLEKEEATPTANEDLPDWLKPAAISSDDNFFTPQNDEPLPDWLMTTPEIQTPSANEPDNLMNLDWQSTPGEPGSTPAEITPEFFEASTIAFDQEVQAEKISAISLEKQEPPENLPPAEPSAAVVDQPDLNDFDQAMAWLESLAAKQGAEEETLISNPAERPVAPPEWVSEATQEAPEAAILDVPAQAAVVPVRLDKGKAQQSAEPEEIDTNARAEVESILGSSIPEAPISSDEPVYETTPVVETDGSAELGVPWIPIETSAEQPETNLEIAAALPTETLDTGDQAPVDAIAELPQPASDTPASVGQAEEMDMDAAFAWLESLAAKQGAEADTLLASPETRQETPPDWVQQQAVEAELPLQSIEDLPEESANRMPGWIKSSEETPGSAEVTQPFDQDLPDWLKETESSPLSTPQPTSLPAVEEPLMPDETETLEEPPIAETALSAEGETPTWIQESDLVEKEETPAQFEQDVPKPPETQQRPAGFGHTRPLPSWLAGGSPQPPTTPEESSPVPQESDLPDWLKTEDKFSTHQPSIEQADRAEGDGPALPDWLKNLEPDQEEDLIPGPPVLAEIVQPAPSEIEISSQPDEMIGQAQTALSKGHIDFALTIYARLIEKRQHLEDSIHDLRDALYRYPVDSAIWQTLGDAYFQNNRVQDALDAYTKAEDFLK